jgi:subtilisin family serine protease
MANSLLYLLVAVALLTSLAIEPYPVAATSSAPGTYVVVLKDSVADPRVDSADHSRRYGIHPNAVFVHAIRGYAADMTPVQAAAVEANPGVQFVVPDRKAKLAAGTATVPCGTVPPDAAQCMPHFVDRIDADLSSTRAGDGRGSVNVNVAIIDSGIAGDHPDLNVKGGADCSSGAAAVPGTSLTDEVPHGTLVAGVVGARDNGIGVVGVAPGAPLWSVKVAHAGDDVTLSRLLCAVDWVTSTRDDSDPTNDVSVANMSVFMDGADDGLCGLANHDALHLAICRSVAAGVTYVALAGNDATDLAAFVPGAYKEVLTATAMADFDGKPGGKARPDCYGLDVGPSGAADDTPAPFSNFAVSPSDYLHTVAAPGVCVETTTLPGLGLGGYTVDSGTSFAAPAVAGTVALCIAARKCRSGDLAGNLAFVVHAIAYNVTHPSFGFEGDPIRPKAGRCYGFLVIAGIY